MKGMIIMPMTMPAASADSDEALRSHGFGGAADEGGEAQSGEEAIDDGGDACEDFEHGLGDGVGFGAGIFGHIDGRHESDGSGDEQCDEGDQQSSGEERDDAELSFGGDLSFAQSGLRIPF